MTRRKIITRACACLVLGLVTTWAVAWGLAAAQYLPSATYISESSPADPPESCYVVDTWTHASVTGQVREFYWGGVPGVDIEYPWEEIVGDVVRPHAVVPPGMRLQSNAAKTIMLNGKWYDSLECAWGWPCLALWSLQHRQTWPVREVVVAGLALPTSWGPPKWSFFRGNYSRVLLPVVPIWLGILADTAFYGLLWTLPLLGLPLLRSRRRARRGLCPACGYDLKADLAGGCPECGWKRATPTPRTPMRRERSIVAWSCR